jgi:hypothetical protein
MRDKARYFRIMNLVVAGALRLRPGRALLRRLPPIQRYRELYRSLFAQELADWPQQVRDPLVERHVSLDWLGVGLKEASNADRLYDEIRHAGAMLALPLIVLCSMATDGFKEAVSLGESASLLNEEIESKRRLYTDWVASVQRGEVRLVDAATSPCTCAGRRRWSRQSRICSADPHDPSGKSVPGGHPLPHP